MKAFNFLKKMEKPDLENLHWMDHNFDWCVHLHAKKIHMRCRTCRRTLEKRRSVALVKCLPFTMLLLCLSEKITETYRLHVNTKPVKVNDEMFVSLLFASMKLKLFCHD